MAKFVIKKMRFGDAENPSYYISLTDIIFDGDEETVYLPETWEGERVTYFGYEEKYEAAHEAWADWHHPSKGSDLIGAKYGLNSVSIKIPEHVKTIVFPKTTSMVSEFAFNYFKGVTVEVDPEHPYYCSDGKHIKTKPKK